MPMIAGKFAALNSHMFSTLTFICYSQPEYTEGGKYAIREERQFTMRGLFVPSSHKLAAGKAGDFINAEAEVIISKAAMDEAGISAATLVVKVIHNDRNFVVLSYDDYTEYDGCYRFYIAAEVGEVAY